MWKNRNLASTILLLVSSFATPYLHATLIDFENVVAAADFQAVGPNYLEDGFNLFNPGSPTDSVIVSQSAGFNGTGSDFYTWNNIVGNNPVVLTNASGQTFDFYSLDVGTLDLGLPVSFDITGHLASGGIITQTVIAADAFAQVNLNWASLTSVDFTYASGQFPAIDNLKVDISAVPEPTSLVFLGLGIAALGFRNRKKM